MRVRGRLPADAGVVEFTGMLPAVLLVFVVVWEAFLIGMSMTYAGHAANEGARVAAVHGGQAEIEREAVRRISGGWAEEGAVSVVHQPDAGYVRVAIRPPLLFPGVLLPMQVSARAKVVYEGAG